MEKRLKNDDLYQDTHTLLHYLQVAITTPEGGS